MKLKDPSLKFSHLLPSGHSAQHGRAMESLIEIPEEKEGSNTRVNSSDSAAVQDGNEEIHKDEKDVLKENSLRKSNLPDQSKQDQARGSHGSIVKVANSSGSSAPGEGQKSTSKVVETPPNTSTGSHHAEEAKSSQTNKGKTQSEEPTLQRKNSMRMKVYSLLTSDDKKASKKEEKLFQRKGSLRSKSTSGSNQPLKADHSQAPAVDQTPKKGQSPSISRSQNSVSGPAETEKQKFPRLSTQRSSKRKTNPTAEQDRGSGSTPNVGAACQRQKAYSRFEYFLNTENVPKDKGSSLSRSESPMYQTQSGTDNKLGKFMQRVGNFIGKK
ncbi:hypothetical protein GBF38_003055 [Nibea albiflora]|uniref:Uncharacterized protein n=1 Tax=Nibea albiflora TaxID=240163 RepID=A0ACB7FK42_NIBAL|nr:hypothetical protein GBF38_003055 [Nibea albiflora]